jgi:elongation factor P
MIEASKLKVGNLIVYENKPYETVKVVFSKMGRQKGMIRSKMKNLATGNLEEVCFRDSDRFEEFTPIKKKAKFLYKDGDTYYFMDNEEYEQYSLNEETLGDIVNYLKEDLDVELIYDDENLLNVTLPIKLDFKVTEAPPAVKGNSADGGVTKKVKIETGYELNAPIFIKQGDQIKINTQTGEYVERVKE